MGRLISDSRSSARSWLHGNSSSKPAVYVPSAFVGATEPELAAAETRSFNWLSRFFILAGLLFCLSCRSTGDSTGNSIASVIITGNTPGQIRDVAVDIFSDNGYKVASSSPDHIVFEKQGGGMSNFAYGNWMGSEVWVRVRAAIVPVHERTFRLQCSVFMVRDIGSATEEEVTLTRIHQHSFQNMLDEVAKRLAAKG